MFRVVNKKLGIVNREIKFNFLLDSKFNSADTVIEGRGATFSLPKEGSVALRET